MASYLDDLYNIKRDYPAPVGGGGSASASVPEVPASPSLSPLSSAGAGPLAWANLGLGAMGAVGSGIDAYLSFREKQKQAALQEEMMRNEDRRAEQAQKQAFKAYDEAGGQRSANTMATMAPVLSQAETFRDRLRMLRGGV